MSPCLPQDFLPYKPAALLLITHKNNHAKKGRRVSPTICHPWATGFLSSAISSLPTLQETFFEEKCGSHEEEEEKEEVVEEEEEEVEEEGATRSSKQSISTMVTFLSFYGSTF